MKDKAIFIFKNNLSEFKRKSLNYVHEREKEAFEFIAILPTECSESIRKDLSDIFNSFYDIELHKCAESGLHVYDYSTLLNVVKTESDRTDDKSNTYLIGIDEVTLLDVAKIRDELGLYGHGVQDLERFRIKDIMLSHARSKGINCPKSVPFDMQAFNKDKLNYYTMVSKCIGLPFLLKPNNAAGSIGILKIESQDDFIYKIQNMRGNDYTINEYIKGSQYHCEVIIKDGALIFEKCSKLIYPAIDFVLDKKILASIPMSKGDDFYNEVVEYNRKVVKAFEIDNITTTCEFFITGDGEFTLIEINARLPGEPQTYTYFQETDVWMDYLDFKIQTNDDFNFDNKNNQIRHCAWVFVPCKKGILASKTLPKLKSIAESKWDCEIGDKLRDPDSIYDHFLQVILTSSRVTDIKHDLKVIEKEIFIKNKQ